MSQPHLNSTCRVCSAPLPAHAGECRQCGAVYDEASRCPHCRALAGTELRAGRYVCRICGGPRVPAVDRRLERRGSERLALMDAQSHLRSAKRRGALAVLAGFFAVLSALVAATLGWLEAPLAAASWIASASWFVGMLVAWNRARSARRAGAQAETRAWVDVTEEAVSSFPAVTERNVAELLGVDRTRADDLLTELVREERVTSEIDDDGQVIFRKPRLDGPALRLRVDDELASDREADDESEAPSSLESVQRKRM